PTSAAIATTIHQGFIRSTLPRVAAPGGEGALSPDGLVPHGGARGRGPAPPPISHQVPASASRRERAAPHRPRSQVVAHLVAPDPQRLGGATGASASAAIASASAARSAIAPAWRSTAAATSPATARA